MNLRHMGRIGCSIPLNEFKTLLTHGCRGERISLVQVKDRSDKGEDQTRVNNIVLNISPSKWMESSQKVFTDQHVLLVNFVSYILGVVFNKFFKLYNKLNRFSMHLKRPLIEFSDLTGTVYSKLSQITVTKTYRLVFSDLLRCKHREMAVLGGENKV